MRGVFLPRADWVLSGSIEGWGNELSDAIDLVVFVVTPTDVRLARLRAREARHFGAEAIAQGGWRYPEAEKFFDWASHYEDGTREGRSRSRHEAWLSSLMCPVVRVDGSDPIDKIVGDVVGFWFPKP
jgi:adenylate kinase family enzyme